MSESDFDMTLEEAKVAVAKLVLRTGIPGLKGHRRNLFPPGLNRSIMQDAKGGHWGMQSFCWEQSWGVGCDLRMGWKDGEKTYQGKKRKVSLLTCEVSWSSTGRNLRDARASIVLYGQVTDLACLIESHIEGLLIESAGAHYDRQHKVDVKRAKSEMKIGDLVPLKWVKGRKLKDGSLTPGRYDTDGVMWDLRPEVINNVEGQVCCAANLAGGKMCSAKAKTLAWVSPAVGFVVRCNRHKDNIGEYD